MKFNFNIKDKYKNSKEIDFLLDLKDPKKLTTSVVVPYSVMLAPIFVIWVCYFVWWAFGFTFSFVGFLNTFPLWVLCFGLILLLVMDIRRIYLTIVKNTKSIKPIKSLLSAIKQYPEICCLFSMFLWILIATVTNPNPNQIISLYHGKYMQEGLIFYLGYLVIFISSFLLQDRNSHHRLLIAFLISSIFAGLTTIIDPSSTFVLASHNNTGWAFGMTNSNHYGYFLTLAVICSASMFLLEKSEGVKIFCGLTFLLNTIVLLFNDTLGCLVAVLLTLICIPVFISLRNHKFKWSYLTPLLSFMLLSFIISPIAKYVPNTTYKSLAGQLFGLVKDFFSVTTAPLSEEASHAGTDRWSLWLKALQGIKEHPVTGTGNVFFKPHNEYLQHAYNFGALCLVFYLVSLVIILIKTLKNLRCLSDITLVLLLSTLAYLISAVFGNTMPHTMMFFLVFLAFAIRNLNKDIKANKEDKLVNSAPQN